MSKSKDNDCMGSIIVRDIDNELRKQFRLLCIGANISMSEAIRLYIKRVVEGGKLK